jgi:hypothetical protein
VTSKAPEDEHHATTAVGDHRDANDREGVQQEGARLEPGEVGTEQPVRHRQHIQEERAGLVPPEPLVRPDEWCVARADVTHAELDERVVGVDGELAPRQHGHEPHHEWQHRHRDGADDHSAPQQRALREQGPRGLHPELLAHRRR